MTETVSASAARFLVIGCGNTLRGDDAAGCVAAERVAIARPDVTVLLRHQLTPELAEPVSRAQAVVFLDASAETAPGHVTITRLQPATSADPGVTHHVRPAVLLALAAFLYNNAPTATLITVGASSFAFGAPLSPQVEAALPQMVAAAMAALVAAA